VAKARDRAQTTTHGRVKGKIAYMSPEQLAGERVDRRTDVFAAGVVLWQLLTGRPLVAGDSSAATANNVLFAEVEPPSRYAVSVSPELEEITLRALSREPSERFENARQMAAAIERDVALATVTQVGEWVEETAGPVLERRSRLISELRAAERPESPDRDLRAASATQVTLAPPKRRLSSRAIALAATLPFVGAAVWAGLRPRSGAVTVVAAPGPGSSNVAAAEPSPPAQSASTAGPEPPAGASAVRPSEPPTFASRRSPPPAPHGRTGKPRAAVPPGAAPVTDAPARGGSPCKPPYTIDGDGVRHYKPDCPLE
jgi:serine/threonine-protein kinase